MRQIRCASESLVKLPVPVGPHETEAKLQGPEHRKVRGVTPVGARTHHEIVDHTLMFASLIGGVGFFGAKFDPVDENLVASIFIAARRHHQ